MADPSGTKLSNLSCLLGLCGVVVPVLVPLLTLLRELPDALVRASAYLPVPLILAGLATGIAARRRGAAASARTAIAWNALILLGFAGMTVMVYLNPPTPS